MKCKGTLTLDVFDETSEINEGFFLCNNCNLKFPIISKIPILVENLSKFLANRSSLGGLLFELSLTKTMKNFLKITMSKIQKPQNDFFQTEKRWTQIYLLNKKSSFYKNIKLRVLKIPKKNFIVEYGSSIGLISNMYGLKHAHIFGIDTSFSALYEAKKKSSKNCEYILADVIRNPLGKKKFDLIVALNMFELVEPHLLIKTISKQILNGFILLSDPYDYERGKNSVKNPLNENQIRETLRQHKFKIDKACKNPSKINWNLKINDRTQLNYKVDIIIARKSS